MLRRRVGVILVGIGTTLLVVAGVGTFVPGGDDPGAAASPATSVPTTTPPPQTTVAATASSTTTEPPTTTTAAETTTTTTQPPTTTTTTMLAPEAVITTFIGEFSSAITTEDTDWLLDNLHPSIILGYTEELCRSFIDREILELKEYTLIGDITGPVTKTLETGVGDVTVEGIYEAETSFVFNGKPYEAKADFVFDDQVSWLTKCR